MKTTLIVIGLAALAWILLMLFARKTAQVMERVALSRARSDLAGEGLVLVASHGRFLQAAGPSPFNRKELLPGTDGVLALTDRRLAFFPWTHPVPLFLPRNTIAAARLPEGADSPAPGLPVLTVTLRGSGDAKMSFLLNEPEKWVEALTVTRGSLVT